ncbi:D-alanyl-D-alanine carboxypeptidase/D-alanyl-D-alanine-endopeptidase [Elusimicrobiota bacterium]
MQQFILYPIRVPSSKTRASWENRPWRTISLAALCLCAILTGCAPKAGYKLVPANPLQTINQSQATEKIAGAINGSNIDSSYISMKVIELDAEDVVYSLNPRKRMIPASTTKLLTTAASLELLEADYRFKTEVYHTGEIEEGELTGDLWIKGYCDPTMDLALIQKIIGRMKELGIRNVNGSFFLDISFAQEYEHINRNFSTSGSYNTALGPLSFESNRIKFTLAEEEDRKSKQTPLVAYFKPVQDMAIATIAQKHLPIETHHKPQFDVVWDDQNQRHEVRIFENTLAPTKKTIALRKPGFAFGQIFKHVAKKHGIKLGEIEFLKTSPYAKKVITVKSHDLGSILRQLNYRSNNFIAEQLVLTIGNDLGGKGTLKTGLSLITAYLDKKVGFAPNSYKISNGSGLSRETRISSHHLVKLLLYAAKNPAISTDFINSLPVSGWNGTIAKRLDSPGAILSISAKTGHIDYVSAIAGYATTANNKRLVFTILMNDLKGLIETSDFTPIQREEEEEWQRTTAIASNFRALQDQILEIITKTAF